MHVLVGGGRGGMVVGYGHSETVELDLVQSLACLFTSCASLDKWQRLKLSFTICQMGLIIISASQRYLGLPRWCSGKESACQGRRCRREGFNPWVEKIPWRRKWQPTPIFLPRVSHGQRSLAGYSPWSCKKLDTTEHAHIYTDTHTQKKISDLYTGFWGSSLCHTW